MTAPAPPPVDPELAEAEEAARDCVEIQCTLTAGPLTRLMAEYDARLLRIKSGVDMVTALAREAASLRAELSRLRRIESAAHDLHRVLGADDDPEWSDLGTALAAEVQEGEQG